MKRKVCAMLALLVLIIIGICLLQKHNNLLTKEEVVKYCEDTTEHRKEFYIHTINEYNNYLFLISADTYPELYIFERDSLFKSRYSYLADSKGLIEDNASVGVIVTYLKRNGTKQEDKVLLAFSSNSKKCKMYEYEYNNKIMNNRISTEDSFVISIPLDNQNNQMKKIMQSIKFLDIEGKVVK